MTDEWCYLCQMRHPAFVHKKRRFLCRLGFHVMRPWVLPEEYQARLLAARWSWSAQQCIHCERSNVTLVRVRRTDGKTGSLHG